MQMSWAATSTLAQAQLTCLTLGTHHHLQGVTSSTTLKMSSSSAALLKMDVFLARKYAISLTVEWFKRPVKVI